MFVFEIYFEKKSPPPSLSSTERVFVEGVSGNSAGIRAGIRAGAVGKNLAVPHPPKVDKLIGPNDTWAIKKTRGQSELYNLPCQRKRTHFGIQKSA